MTPVEVAKVLAKMAAFDQRTVGEADIAAWYEVIGHLDVFSCLSAVTAHYREGNHRAMPADIRKLATDTQARERAADDRRQRGLEAAAAHPTKTGKAICMYVLKRLRDAGQDPANGQFLGKDRAGDIAEQAAWDWLALTDAERQAELEKLAMWRRS